MIRATAASYTSSQYHGWRNSCFSVHAGDWGVWGWCYHWRIHRMLDDFCAMNAEIQHKITSATIPNFSQTLEQILNRGWQVLFNSQNNHRTYITTMWKPLNWLSNVRSGFVESTKWLNLRACSDQRQGLYIGECQGQGKNAESLLTSEKGGTSTTAVTTHLTVCMLCCSWDGGIHERCGLNPSGLRGKCQCAIQSSWMHGMALVMEERHPYQPGRDQKFRYPKTAMGMRAEKPYLVGI